MPNWAQAERRALCDLFVEVGPDAPTLSGAWTTRDLAAHLIVREGRPDAAAGILLPPLADHGERVRREIAQRPWPELVNDVRHGPPIWSPMRIDAVDRLTNTIEFFVHHEDVRRAADGWQPRALDPRLEKDLWQLLRRMARLLVRKAPCGVVLERAGGESITAKKAEPAATVHGPVGELLLFCYGRQAHSHVDITAPADVAEQLRTASLGL